jgi:type IV secretory pathway VirB2 component (pilin)
MSFAAFFQNLLQLFISIQGPAATTIVIVMCLAAACKFIYWHSVFETALALAGVFAAANLVNTIYG